MRRLVIAMSLAALLAPAAASAGAAGTGPRPPHVTVSPRAGTPSTRFKVRFTTPVRTGAFLAMRSWETAGATGPESTRACSGTAGRRARPGAANARVAVQLAPAGKPWCAGSYTGTVTLYRAIRCPPGPVTQRLACPLIEIAPERIGRFRFTVRRVQPQARDH